MGEAVAVRPLPPPPRRILYSSAMEAGAMPQRTADRRGPIPLLRPQLLFSGRLHPVPRAARVWRDQWGAADASSRVSTAVDLAWRGGRGSSVPASLDCTMPAEAPSTSAPAMRSSLANLACPHAARPPYTCAPSLRRRRVPLLLPSRWDDGGCNPHPMCASC